MRYLVRRPESVIDKFLSDVQTPSHLGSHLDVYKENDKYMVEVDLPGYKKEDIKLDFKEDVLTIEASYNQESENDDKEMIYKSRTKRSVRRQIRFEEVNVDEIEAEFVDGVLKVSLPLIKKVEPESKQIELK